MCHRGTCIRPLSGASGTPAKFAGYPACDMPASLLIQRPRHATCQRYFRPSGLGMRHAGASGTPAKFTRGVCGSSRKSLGICRGVCAGSAGSLGVCRGVCAGGASLSAFAAAFAQAAQVSRCLPWRLRRRRGVSRHLPRRLRKRRKSLGVCRGVCAGSASLSAFARPGFLTALPRAGRWGVCWASSRRPTRGERRRRGLRAARSAGC